EHGAEFSCDIGDRAFALVMEETLHRGGREEQRQCEFLSKYPGAQVHRLYSRQHARHEIMGVECLGVAAQGALIVRAAVHVMKNGGRKPCFREFAKIGSIEAILQTHGIPLAMTGSTSGKTIT